MNEQVLGERPSFQQKHACLPVLTQTVGTTVGHLIGSVDESCEGIAKLIQVGTTTIATATYTIIDKRTMMRRVSVEIMANFRN